MRLLTLLEEGGLPTLLTLGSGGFERLGAYSMYQNEMIEIFSKLTEI